MIALDFTGTLICSNEEERAYVQQQIEMSPEGMIEVISIQDNIYTVKYRTFVEVSAI